MSTGTIARRSTNDSQDGREIEGVAIVFNRESETLYEDEEMEIREIIAPESVTRSLLDGSTILLTLYHNNERILGRSIKGSGSLTYEIREDGVHFRCSMPNTPDGDTAIELVSRSDITGCSFAFRANYGDRNCVERTEEQRDGKRIITYKVKRMAGIYDFTLTPLPAYPDTEVGRQLRDLLKEEPPVAPEDNSADLARLRKLMESHF